MSDPFTFFQPWVLVSDAERTRLMEGGVVARTLPATDGQVAVFASARLQAAPEALVTWTHAIDALKRNEYVRAVRRFSPEPSLADLDALVLDEGDLQDMRSCRPGRCGVKLAATEMASLRAVGSRGEGWKGAIEVEFKRLMLERVTRYLREGPAGLLPYADRSRAVDPTDVFTRLLAATPYLERAGPELTAALNGRNVPSGRAVDSFLYWSKERYGAGKNVVSASHVHLVRRESEDPALPIVMATSRQLFATHYSDGALSVTAVVCDARSGACFLTYLSRTQSDVLSGMLGGLRRAIIEQRIESETPTLVRELRRRLESGNPQPAVEVDPRGR